MLYAYLIEDVRALSDLFKVGVGPKKSAHGEFTVYRVRHPEYVTRRALIITGVPKSGLAQPIPATVGHEIKIDVKDGELFWYDDQGQKLPVEVLGVGAAPSLEQLIEPVPWRVEAELDGPVIFWLKRDELMPEIVRRSLYLNNDRVQISRQQAGEQVAVLVRIESPSYYLLAWCQEQPAADIEIYYPMTDGQGLFVQWGYEHPLSDLWRRAWLDQSESWMFFPAQGGHQVLAKPEWQSLYELADFSLNIDQEQSWSQISSLKDRFDVPLKLAYRHEPSPVELVVLKEQDRKKLEDFLALSDEDELDKLEISAQSDEQDQRWYFVREKHRSDGILLVELGGEGYARYKGFDNLFLPVDLVLEPQLRRDQYKALFELESNTLTFVMPERHSGSVKDALAQKGLAAKTVRVKKRSFEPLSHFVDHLVHFQGEALYSLLEQSIFDLEVYKDAPSNPELRRGKAEAQGPGKGKLPGERPGVQDKLKAKLRPAKQAQDPSKQAATLSFEATAAAQAQEKSTPTELDILETEAERELIRKGPQVQLWQSLMAVKHRRHKWLEASVCAVEGMWALSFPEDRQVAAAPDPQALQFLRDGFKAAITKAGQEPKELAVVSQIFGAAHADPSDEDIATIMMAAGELRGVDAKLGKKVRWLVWRDILVQTKDVRQQEEIREAILSELNKKGLESLDSPTFLRERILKDPDLEFGDDGLDGSGDSSYVLQNVEAIEQSISQLKTEKIKAASKASLSRILAGMGLHARARDLISASLEEMELSLSKGTLSQDQGKAWHQRLMDFFRAKPESNAAGATKPERWHVWVALNAWLVYQRVEPARAEEAKAAYELMFNQLANYEKEDMRKTAQSLEARVGQSNVAEFLAVDSRSFFSSRDLPDEMSKVIRGLKQSQNKSEEKNVNELVLRGIKLASKELTESSSPSLETVARLILEMVEVLRKLKWEKEQRPVDQFEEFVRELPKEPASADASRLYFAVLHCAATRALMDLGREKEAMQMLVDILKWVAKDYMQVLDFVDLVKKEVLLAIELAPRNQRTEALRHLMSTLVEQERLEIGTDPEHPGTGFEMPFQAYEIIQMIDHTLEAAISNEKLVLRRLRDFEEHEEARIRYWIQRDQPASA